MISIIIVIAIRGTHLWFTYWLWPFSMAMFNYLWSPWTFSLICEYGSGFSVPSPGSHIVFPLYYLYVYTLSIYIYILSIYIYISVISIYVYVYRHYITIIFQHSIAVGSPVDLILFRIQKLVNPTTDSHSRIKASGVDSWPRWLQEFKEVDGFPMFSSCFQLTLKIGS